MPPVELRRELRRFRARIRIAWILCSIGACAAAVTLGSAVIQRLDILSIPVPVAFPLGAALIGCIAGLAAFVVVASVKLPEHSTPPSGED